MSSKQTVIPGMAFLIPLKAFRRTPSVEFHLVPEVVQGLSSVDRVRHAPGAQSPMVLSGDLQRFDWYMHPDQEDNLLVMEGRRLVELYTTGHGKTETFEVTPESVKHGDTVLFDGPAILGWPPHVFHRIKSPQGSLSVNFAKHFPGFDLKTNFNIYELDTKTGVYSVSRLGDADQF